MKTDEVIQRVQSELQHRFRVAGRGSVQRVQEELQLGSGYFRDLRRPERQRFDLRILLDALNSLEVDPAEFFSRVLGASDPLNDFQVVAAELSRRHRRPPRILALESERLDADGTVDADGMVANNGKQYDLANLDSERQENPKRVLRQACAWISDITADQIPRLLGIHASASRALGRLDEAHIVLGRALELTTHGRGDASVLGELLQRASYIVSDKPDYAWALRLSEKAVMAHLTAGDLVGVGKTLMDCGAWQGFLGHYEGALQSFRSALQYLPADSERFDVRINRTSCWQNLAMTYVWLDQPERGLRFLRKARRSAKGLGRMVEGKALCLEASYAMKLKRYAQAERQYRRALGIYQSIDPLNAATCSVDLARVQLVAGRHDEAYATAKAMTVYLTPLENNEIASAAIAELVRCALAGRGLTLAILDDAAQRFENEKGRAGSQKSRTR